MIGATTSVKLDPQKVTNAVNKATFKNLNHAAASIRKAERESIEKAEGPSAPGSPPHTHNRQFLKNAIVYDVDKEKQEAVIGPRFSRVGTSAKAHEFGGEYKGAEFPERSFALPVLLNNLERFAGQWAGSIGE